MCEAVSRRLRTRSCCGGCEQRPFSACSRQVGEQVVRRAAGNDKAGEPRTRCAAASGHPVMPYQCDNHPHTAIDHCRPLASIPASPAENDVALSRHCAGCRPHPPTRGTEDLRSCCCALQARAEHRVIMLTRRRAVSMLPSAEAAPPSASTTELRNPAVHTLRIHTVPGRRALFWPQSGRIRVSGCRGR